MRWRRLTVVATALAYVAACTSAPPVSPSATSGGAGVRGGVLRIGVQENFPPGSLLAKTGPDDFGDPVNALDPHAGVFYDTLELLRCCLVRTLLSYEGKPLEEGGTTLRPDLAESLPEVSEDGLEWTFRLRRGVHYAPPLQDVEITSADFVRSLRRLLPRFEPAFRPAIAGMEEYIDGRATTISGLQSPDPYTLRIRLTRPQGDLPARLAYPDMAPIPAHPADPLAQFGVATGHDADYGRFLVSSGPYMVEGADRIDFSLPPGDRVPASGHVPGESLTLVRNPSWVAAPDPLRPAHVDRIQIVIGGTQDELAARVESDDLDFVLHAGPPPHAPLEQIERFQADQSLGGVYANSRDFVRAVALNIALPPFDDIHVRKAANLVIDKARLIELAGGRWTGEVAGHIVLNSLEENLLLTYDPYRTPGSAGDLAAAAEEMKQSKYDTDGDGVCDGAACDGLTGVTFLVFPALAESVTADLARLGINVEVEAVEPFQAFARWDDPTSRTSLMVGLAYGKDHLNASTFFTALFDSRSSIAGDHGNGTHVGASPEQLEAWGYEPLMLPNIDDRIDLCHGQTGGSQVQCWAGLDQHLMENVVPWVPYSFERHTRTVGRRVVHYSFDQSIALPALDQIQVAEPP
jgi:peptide/nickel transport system substrate-binding protein